MYRTPAFLLAALAVALCPLAAAAQAPPAIEKVRIGLPSAGRSTEESGRSRSGSWAPVAVLIKSSAAGHPQGAYRLRIETTDLEEQAYQYTVAVPAMAANSERTVQGYIVPGSDSATFSVRLETVEGRRVDIRDKLTRDTTRGELVADQDILFLAAGAGLSSLERATRKIDQAEEEKDKKANKEDDSARGKRQFVFAEDVVSLPDRWYGYDAVDVVVLATGKVDFVNALAQEGESARRNALLEWVRRGGQLVMSVGRNKQEVSQLLAKLPLIDCKVTGSSVAGALPVLTRDFCKFHDQKEPLRKVEVATLVPGPETHVMVRESFGPVLVEASCGLGRVVLVGFDLDAGEFAGWKGQEAFWTRLQEEIAPYLKKVRPGRQFPGGGQPGGMPPGGVQPPGGMPGGIQPDDGLTDASGNPIIMRAEIKRSLELFEEVPVIHFGYVALFLLLYIALVGPLDYFLLKKVFKRLELTWVTFPVTVLLVSVAAYFIAFAMKGDDLRVNKIDLIDVDMHQPRQAYGHSWFTLFSPRAQSYTVGIEPPVGTWTDAIPEGAPGPVVTLLEGGDNTRRQASQGLFSKPYQYAEDATGLQYVPVPVWSTRSFTASWRAPLLKNKPPVGIEDDEGKPIRTPRDKDGVGLVGRLTNNLPVPLKDVCLFYQERWYTLGDLAPGEQRRLEPYFAQNAAGQHLALADFFTSSKLAPGLPLAPSGRPVGSGFRMDRQSYQYMKRMMFYQKAPWSASNAGLRTLDQTWRLNQLPQYPEAAKTPYREEVILVARAPMLCDRAEEVIDHGASGSRLWLGKLPAAGEERPAVSGVITQETYLRVFIPVQRGR